MQVPLVRLPRVEATRIPLPRPTRSAWPPTLQRRASPPLAVRSQKPLPLHLDKSLPSFGVCAAITPALTRKVQSAGIPHPTKPPWPDTRAVVAQCAVHEAEDLEVPSQDRTKWSLAKLNNAVAKFAGNAEAASTKKNRDRIMERFTEFCHRRQVKCEVNSIHLFLAETAVKARSQITYASSLKARVVPKDQLNAYLAALRRRAAQDPVAQAKPVTWAQVQMAMGLLSHIDALGLYLAWKTVARMDDIGQLQRESMLPRNPLSLSATLTVHWNHTKTAALDPWQPQLFVVVGRPHPSLARPNFVPVLAENVRKCPRGPFLNPGSTKNIIAALKKVDPQLSGHSVKRGAATELMQRAAEGKFPVNLVQLVAGHVSRQPMVSSSTLRYVHDPTLVADALNSMEATQWL